MIVRWLILHFPPFPDFDPIYFPKHLYLFQFFILVEGRELIFIVVIVYLYI